MGLDDAMWANCLCRGRNSMMLHVARLDMLWVTRSKWHVLAFFVLQADLPTCKEFWTWLHVLKPWVLEGALELPAHDVFEAIVRDDVVVRALVFD